MWNYCYTDFYWFFERYRSVPKTAGTNVQSKFEFFKCPFYSLQYSHVHHLSPTFLETKSRLVNTTCKLLISTWWGPRLLSLSVEFQSGWNGFKIWNFLFFSFRFQHLSLSLNNISPVAPYSFNNFSSAIARVLCFKKNQAILS